MDTTSGLRFSDMETLFLFALALAKAITRLGGGLQSGF